MQTRPTPTPWYEQNGLIYSTANHAMIIPKINAYDIQDPAYGSGKVLMAQDDGGQANSDFIVRAVNSHDALVAALNKAERLLTFLDGSGNNDPTPDRAYVSQVRREFLDLIKSAAE